MSDLPDDIERMADYLGREDPAIRRLLQAYTRDRQMAEPVRIFLKRRCVKAGLDPENPPVFGPVRELPQGIIHLGQVQQGAVPGPQFALPEEIVTQHLGIFGCSGTGKSFLAMSLECQAIREGLHVWVFDIEDEYSRLCSLLPPGQLVAVEPEQLRFNLFQPPGNWVTPASWLDELGLLLRGSMFLRDGSLNLFLAGMTKLLDGAPQGSGATTLPSLQEVAAYFKGLGFGPKSRNAGYLESLVNRFGSLATSLAQTAAVKTSNMLENLAGHSVVFRLHGLVGIPLQYLVSFLLLWLARYKEGSAHERPHLVIIEEPHMLAAEKSRQDIGESVLCRMFRTARKRGVGLILSDQVPSELLAAILGNLACRIVMRLTNAPCLWSLQNSMGLDRKQAETIATLEERHAVVHYTLHPTPFAIEIPKMSFPARPPDSQLRQQAEALLARSTWTEQASPSSPRTSAAAAKILAPDDLAGDPLFVMVRICEEPAEPIEQRCAVLRMDRVREVRARAELGAKGLIVRAEQKVGGKIKLFRPTDKGEAWAQKRAIPVKKFKSGMFHEYLLCQVENRLSLLGPPWRLQRNSPVARDQGLQPDLLVLGPEGQRILVEICCSNPEYDIQNILLEADLSEVNRVVAVASDKRMKKSLQKALQRRCGSTGDLWDAIVLLDTAECLAADFDWQGLLEPKGHPVHPS